MKTHNLYQATITPESTLHCPTHSSPLTNFHYEPSSARLVCSECINDPNFDKSHLIKTHFQVYNDPKAYVISLLNLPKCRGDNEKAPVDFQNCQLEHIIVVQNPIDSQEIKANNGYYPRGLVYIPEKKLLAAGGLDGYLYFWAIGANVEFVRKINIGKQIKFLKYFNLDEKGKCLIIGADSFVHFYDVQDQEPKYIETMTCEAATNDIAYISHQRKLITVGNDSLIRFWSLENSSWKGEKVPKSYGVKGPIITVEYIPESHCLALETNSGLNLLDLEKRELKNTEEVVVDAKRGFSLGHLPKTGQILLFRRESGLNVLDAQNLKLLYEYPGFKPIAFAPGLKFVPNEDESQFISNGNGSCAYICDSKTTDRLDMTGLATKTSGIEVLHDQHRFIVGDQHRGTLFIFKTNVKGDKQHKVEKGTVERISIGDEVDLFHESPSIQEVQIEEEVVVIEEEEFQEIEEEALPKKKAIVPKMKKTSPKKIKTLPLAVKRVRKAPKKQEKEDEEEEEEEQEEEEEIPQKKVKVPKMKKKGPKKIIISPPALKAKDKDKGKATKEQEKKLVTTGMRRTRAMAKSERRVTRSADPKELPRKAHVEAEERLLREARKSNPKDLGKFLKKPTPHPMNGKITLKPLKMKFVLPPVVLGSQGFPLSEENIKKSKISLKIDLPEKIIDQRENSGKIKVKFVLPTRGKRDEDQSRERSRSQSKSPSRLRKTKTMHETVKEGKELVEKTGGRSGYGRGRRSRDKKISYKE